MNYYLVFLTSEQHHSCTKEHLICSRLLDRCTRQAMGQHIRWVLFQKMLPDSRNQLVNQQEKSAVNMSISLSLSTAVMSRPPVQYTATPV